jgi:hypothetical protein
MSSTGVNITKAISYTFSMCLVTNRCETSLIQAQFGRTDEAILEVVPLGYEKVFKRSLKSTLYEVLKN